MAGVMQTGRAEAKAAGLRRYSPGVACKRGHMERLVSTGTCAQCAIDSARLWSKENPDKRRDHQSRYDQKRPRKPRAKMPGRTGDIAISSNPRLIHGLAYLITNTTNGRRYIGITSEHTVARRWWRHQNSARTGLPTPLARAIRKHGAAAFTIEAIGCGKTWSDLQLMEQALIAQHQTFIEDGGYNLTRGGDGMVGNRPSDATRAKQAAQKGWKHSPESKARMKAGWARRRTMLEASNVVHA